MWEGEGSAAKSTSVIKKINLTLQNFLRTSGTKVNFANLPKISVNQISETLPTDNIPPVNELHPDKNDRTSRSRSAKEDKKNPEIRATSKTDYYHGYHSIFNLIYFYNATDTLRSPSPESTDEENTEIYSTPDRSAANLLKKAGKSSLKGSCYYYNLSVYLTYLFLFMCSTGKL